MCRDRVLAVRRRVHDGFVRSPCHCGPRREGKQFHSWWKVGRLVSGGRVHGGSKGALCMYTTDYLTQHLTTPVFGKDVVYDVPNDVFMEQKKFVTVGLSMDNFRAYVGMIEEEVEDFMKGDPNFQVYQMNDINEWGTFQADTVAAEITILTAARTLQGKEVRSRMDKTFSQLYTDLDGGFTPLNFLFPNLPLESYRKRDRAQKKMSDFYVDIIQKRRQSNDDVSI
jgi:sterol 14alpha-demethylase